VCACGGRLLETYERYVVYESSAADVQYIRACPCALCPECGGLTRDPVDDDTSKVFRGMLRCECNTSTEYEG
jgi:hypothetical protein